jgi:serine protease
MTHRITYAKSLLILIAIVAYSTVSFGQAERIKNEFIIQLKKGFSPEVAQQELINHFGILPEIKTGYEISDIMRAWLFTFNEDVVSLDEIIRFAPTCSSIQLAQANHKLAERIVPNDPSYGQQWFHDDATDNDIDTPEAWDITTGGFTAFGDEIVVCVVEGGGAKWDQADIIENHWTNVNEIDGNGIDDDNNGYIDDINGWNMTANSDAIAAGNHGTQVSSMIGAKGNNGIGITGVNWNVKIMQIDMGGVSEANVIAAYTYPLKMRRMYNQSGGTEGAYVVATNSSWGTDNGQPSQAPLWCAMYDTLGVAGILSCGSTANNNVNIDVVGDLPTACPSEYMIAVTATNSSDVRTFSGYGITTIDLGAPGEAVYLAGNNSYGNASGTSFAGPCVAGAIALLYSAPCNSLMSITNSDPPTGAQLVRDYILNGVDVVPNLQPEMVTGGRLNVKNSLDLLLSQCSSGGCVAPFAITSAQTPNTLDYTVSWSSTPDVTTFACQYQLAGSGTWTLIENINANSIILPNLVGCSTYEIQLASVCNDTLGEWTSSFLIETDGCCVNPSVYSVPNTPGATTATIVWNDIFAADGYTIQLTGPNGTDIIQSLQPNITLPNLDSCTTYTIQVGSLCINPENPFTSFEFSTTGCGSCIDIQYCDANGGDASAEYIDAITVGSFTNNSTTNANYTDYTSLNSLTLAAGNTYPVSLTPGFSGSSYSEYFKIWIDYNGNGTFDEPLELAFDAGSGSQSTVTGTITIPEAAALAAGSTRMRVGMAYVGIFGSGNPPTSCGVYSYGEVEDYCVNLELENGIESPTSSSKMLVYPNPASETINLQLPANFQRIQVKIYSNEGKCVKHLSNNSRSFSIAELAAGYYVLEVLSENGIERTKICVE